MSKDTQTWHHGLVARWWAEFTEGGDDVDYFHSAAARCGEPVLDLGCGTGRVLLPLLRAGIDIDGTDASADMLMWCRDAAQAEGLSVGLYQQAMHELNLPRGYRMAYMCGAFGIGGTREQDLEGLRRIRKLLQPGGQLFLDHYLPNIENPKLWGYWAHEPALPRHWPSKGDRRQAQDGTELELRTRVKDIDPLEQTISMEMRASHIVDGEETEVETNAIDIVLYFKNEIELMLRVAGFSDISIQAFAQDRAPLPWQDKRIVFRALAPSES
jgi:SAM-dependent methyltransferase